MRRVLNNRIFKIVYAVFIIIFMIVLSSFLIFNILKGKNLFGYRLYVMPDNSMKGAYNKDDVIVVKKIDNIIIELGNDIAYYGVSDGLENKLIIHRIVRIDNSNKKEILFITQSIDSALPDPAIHKENIIGMVTGKVPILTEFNHLIKNQIGFFLLIVLPLIIILTIEIIRTSILLKIENTTQDFNKLMDRGKNEKKDKE